MDDDGRVVQWPVRQKVQRMVVSYLATRFEPAREYSEREVNDRALPFFRDRAG